MARFSSVLIANRGEIAVRIARSVQDAGFEAVAVFSEPDKDAPHVRACDTAVALGGAGALTSYLDQNKVIAAAHAAGAGAIHPGYGFLSENADFAARCEQEGLVFIGPGADAIRLMGSKKAAKQTVAAAGVPCIPGYEGDDQSDSTLVARAQEIGLPVMVKASAGGGGRGMRLVTDSADLNEAIASARREATSAFGNDELILEKAITTGRHIEIQVAADEHGNVIHLGERDCSMQRRHQKVIEEAPSPFVDQALREAMGQAAVEAAKACGYRGVGTVEFLVDDDRSFSFLEMNTRLQVEHPVTELVTSIDLVDLQLSIAQGEELPIDQAEIALSGHAIEVRVYAEDPGANFAPQTGPVLRWATPSTKGVRVDSGIATGSVVSPYYDPMLAKLIAVGSTRAQALERLKRTLQRTVLLGVKNNLAFLQRLLDDPSFVQGDAKITYLDANPGLQATPDLGATQIALAAVVELLRQGPQRPHLLNWSNAEPMQRKRRMAVNDETFELAITAEGPAYQVVVGDELVELLLTGSSDSEHCFLANGIHHRVPTAFADSSSCTLFGGEQLIAEDLTYVPAASADALGSGEIQALTDGLLVSIEVAEGDQVEAGQTLAVVEAMKMQHRHVAPSAGEVRAINATADTQVSKGQLLVTIDLIEGDADEAADSEGRLNAEKN